MKITFPDKTSLVAVLNAVRDFSEYIRFEFRGPIAKAILLDSTHVSVTCIECVVSVSELQSECPVVFNIANFLRVLDLGKMNTVIDLDITDGSDVAHVILDGGDVRASLKLFECEMDEMDPPQMDGTVIEVTSSDFATRIKDMATLADCVCLKPRENALELSVESDLGTAHVLIKTSNVLQPWDTGMNFALRYLVSILRVSRFLETLSIVMNRDMPLCLKMRNEHISVAFYLAPKFDEEEDAS